MPRGGQRDGAGRKPKYDGRQIQRTLHIPPKLDEKITTEAKKLGESFNQTAIKALIKGLWTK